MIIFSARKNKILISELFPLQYRVQAEPLKFFISAALSNSKQMVLVLIY